MTPLAHGFGNGVCLSYASGVSLPKGFTIWTLTPSGAVTLTITLLTSDTLPIYVRWGDGSGEWVAHNTATSHAYAGAGTYALQISTPDRLTSFVNADSAIAFAGTVDTTAFTALTVLKIRKASITAIDISASVLLETAELNGNALTASEIDDIITDIEAAGLSGGTLNYDTQTGGTEAWASRSAGAQTAQENLEADGWTVTPAKPAAVRMLMHFDSANVGKEEVTGVTINPNLWVSVDNSGVFSDSAKMSAAVSTYPRFDINNANIQNIFKYDFRNPWCFDFWIKFNDLQDYTEIITTYGAGRNIILKARTMTSGQLVVVFEQGAGQIILAYRNDLTTSNYMHVFVQYDGSKIRAGIAGKITNYSNPGATLYDGSSESYSWVYVNYCTANANDKICWVDELCFREDAPYSGNVGDDYTIPSSPFAV